MNELVSLAPWGVVLIVFIGMAWLQSRVIGALDQALVRSAIQPPVPPPPVSIPHITPLAAPPAALPPPPAPKPSGPFPGAPEWFLWMVHEIGFHETGNNGGIDRYIALAHAGANGDPWCAIAANAALEASSISGTRSASSQSFRSHPGFVQLPGPALGAIVVFWRGTPDSGLGHVGFYRGEDAGHIWTLGGNENDMVQIEALPKSGVSFGLVGYWWPKGVTLPRIGAVIMPSGSPVSIQTPPTVASPSDSGGKQTRITATYFGGPKSAYGPAIDDNSPGVALPHRFEGPRPRVRVTNCKTGASVDCDIVDVGPWNTHDPYWETNSRPQAETGVDTTGRKTNGAGIDLTLAAAKAIQIDGKGLCDWSFLPNPSTPKVT